MLPSSTESACTEARPRKRPTRLLLCLLRKFTGARSALRLFLLDRSFRRRKSDFAVSSVAERLVHAASATAQRKSWLAGKVILVSVGVHQFDAAFRRFYSKWAILSRCNLYLCHRVSSNFSKESACTESVLRNRRVYFIGPGQNPAFQIPNLLESRLAQEFSSLGRTLSASAVRNDLTRAIELVPPPRKIAERNQMPAEIADLILMRLANVENVKIISAIESAFQFAWGNFRNGCLRRRRFLAANSAKFGVINQLRDARMYPAHRTIRILAKLQLAELHPQGIEQQ